VRRYASILILLLIATLFAHAQNSDWPPPACKAANTSTVIFRGRVLKVDADPQEPAPPPQPFSDESGNLITMTGAGGVRVFTAHILFEVLEVFKGNPGHEVTVGDGVDYSLFTQGKEYLIYATPSRVPDKATYELWVRVGSHEITNSQDPDLLMLRSPSQSVRIYGEIQHLPPNFDAHNVLLTLTGTVSSQPRIWTTTADDKSAFTFNDVPPGIYTVSASVPGGFIATSKQGWEIDEYAKQNLPNALPKPETTPTGVIPKINEEIISVAPKGCMEADFTLRYDSHIKGRVTDTSGQPVANADVELIDVTQYGNRFNNLSTGKFGTVFQERTTADGTYDFDGLDPLKYSVALSPYMPNESQPYPPVFYPAKSLPSDAAVLQLAPSATLDNIDFVRPDALSPAIVHLRVVSKDGSPINHDMITALDSTVNWSVDRSIAGWGYTDANGNADIHLYAGREYTLTAFEETERTEPSCAGPVEFIAKDGLTLAPLIPDKTNNECQSAPKPALNSASTEPTAANATPANSSNGASAGAGTTPTDDGQIKSVGGGVSTPVAIKRVEPKFSDEAQRQGPLNAIVIVGLVVDKQGLPQNVHVTKGVGLGLDENAVKAVQQYRFKPAMENGKPVAVYLNVYVHFTIFDKNGKLPNPL